MTELTLMKLFREAFMTAAMVSLPMMAAALLVGVAISIFQAVTQIQEITLTFVPKIIAVFAAAVLFGPFILATLIRYFTRLLLDFPMLIRGGTG